MLKFVIFIPPKLGHINPTLGVGAELLRRGHQVVWLGFRELPLDVLPPGGEYYYPEEFQQEKELVEHVLGRQDEAAKNTANKMIKWALTSTWLPFCHMVMKHLPSILERMKPDVLFHDEGLVAAAMCAHKMGIPYATSITAAPGLYYPASKVLLQDDEEWVAEQVLALKTQYGVDTKSNVFNSPNVNVIYTERSFVHGDVFPGNYYFTGPALAGRPPASELDLSLFSLNSKTIYVSTGSLLEDVKRSFYSKAIAAFADKDITVLVTAPQDLFEQWPNNFHVQPYWPQLELLKKVDAIVTPGGFNTINEALLFGVPMLVIPLANDQFYNGALVEQSGAGLRLRFRRLTVDQLSNSVDELLNNSRYKNAAISLKEKLEAGGGGNKIADLLESLHEKSPSSVCENSA
ncbi:MAG: MGT family glycosyltransferase [Flavobacteriales bacterium]